MADISELQFSSVTAGVCVLKEMRTMRRNERSIDRRLVSTLRDARFVHSVRDSTGQIKLLANLRAGKWAYPAFDDDCYFKSADGHVNQWTFPLSRLNLHVVRHAASDGGVMVVDTTRKGKEFPDSFTRTLPIWCAVINRALAREGWDDELYMPLWTDTTEHDNIRARLPAFVKALRESGAALEDYARGLCKPLRCMWISPLSIWGGEDDTDLPTRLRSLPFTPVVCVSASVPIRPGENAGDYVQGPGDDEETWAQGLSATRFWEGVGGVSCLALETGDADLRVREFLAEYLPVHGMDGRRHVDFVPLDDTSSVVEVVRGLLSVVHGRNRPSLTPDTLLMDFSEGVPPADSPDLLAIPVPRHNKNKRKLLRVFPEALRRAAAHLPRPVVLYCAEGLDTPVCVCAALLVKFVDFQGSPPQCLASPRSVREISKDLIQKAFIFISNASPLATPKLVLRKNVTIFFLSFPH